MLLPLAVYSTTFQRSKAKPILATWGVLMLLGAICCLVTLYTVKTTSDVSFNQYRICNTNVTDYHSIPNTLPLLGDNWNQTINNFFNSQPATSKSCFYPCLYSSQILHSPSDITVILYLIVQAGSSRYWAFKILEALVYACVLFTSWVASSYYCTSASGNTALSTNRLFLQCAIVSLHWRVVQ